MKKNLSELIARYGLLSILSVMIIFHLLVLGGVVPYAMVWGGRLTNDSEMVWFEIISIGSLLLMLAIVALHAGFVKATVPARMLKIALWMMAGLFLLNTVGNMQSLNETERLVFTPVTFLLFLFSLRLVFSTPSN